MLKRRRALKIKIVPSKYDLLQASMYVRSSEGFYAQCITLKVEWIGFIFYTKVCSHKTQAK